MKNTKSPASDVIHVELSNRPGVRVAIDAEDWEEWLRSGGSRNLFYNTNGQGSWYVRAFRPDVAGRLVTVAREILKPGRGQVVRHRDGNPLNLRRANLYVQAGTAKGQTPRASTAQAVAA